ncbi:hypothetical protein UFOVP94_18 [uncultured Caudovirales phage]|uniref:Uncharacterized protein n=1 Tax=uncultured Caudovirales phage TaxID=2100421 RepID=A0A6J5L1V6_9CAUD|nr:hypothetical protein UFOVP94_18 [uncultured Caudovirales phage]CAB5212523.1 hypothetical protein UFOVP186_25 [uncultured Caudovirales phage]
MLDEYIQEGLTILDDVTPKINARQTSPTGLQKNDHKLWKIYHSWDNQTWDKILLVALKIIEQAPEYVSEHQHKMILTAAEALNKNWDEHPRVLDTSGLYKMKTMKYWAWGAINSIAEVMDQINKNKIVNTEALKYKIQNNLFERK